MSFPTRMVVGPGALARLPGEMRTLEAEHALIVSDRGLEEAGVLEQVQQVLQENGLLGTAYLGVSKNPKERDVVDGVETYRRARAELVIGLGGGGPMDVAKAIALKCTHHLPLEAYDDMSGGCEKIHANQPPMIAIPTTAGTGSEVGRASVVCLGDDGRKVVIFSPHMMPKVAICDPKLTVDLPPAITAATGMDALTHNLEAYVAVGNHPFADMFALAGLARVGVHLEKAVTEGDDLKSRNEMLLASSMGAIAFQKGLGACHSLAHPLSAVADLHHGLANSIMLPLVIRYNMEDALERYAVAGQALGAPHQESLEDRAAACLDRVTELVDKVGLPTRLGEVGVEEEMIDDMVEQAIQDGCHGTNPTQLTEEGARKLYREAM